jgi:hypothetical protein
VRRWISAGAIVLGLLAAPSLAGAANPSAATAGLLSSRWLWATVDVCTTASSSDVVGIRGSMPGTGDHKERMYMYFRLQYRGSKGVWHFVGQAGDSGFVYAGTAAYVSRQAGSNFHLAASTAPGTKLRGEVYFDWRVGSRVEHHVVLATTAGHIVGAGSSPRGFSAAACTIS